MVKMVKEIMVRSHWAQCYAVPEETAGVRDAPSTWLNVIDQL